jgi:hypothetical protein
MKMGGKFPAKVIVLLVIVLMTHKLFRDQGYKNLNCSEAVMGEGGHSQWRWPKYRPKAELCSINIITG